MGDGRGKGDVVGAKGARGSSGAPRGGGQVQVLCGGGVGQRLCMPGYNTSAEAKIRVGRLKAHISAN